MRGGCDGPPAETVVAAGAPSLARTESGEALARERIAVMVETENHGASGRRHSPGIDRITSDTRCATLVITSGALQHEPRILF